MNIKIRFCRIKTKHILGSLIIKSIYKLLHLVFIVPLKHL